MRRLLVFPLALLFLVAACEDSGPSPMAGPGDLAGPLLDLQVEGDHFFFLPPLASNPSTTGTPDMERSPRVVVCPVNGTECPADGDRTFDADAAGDHYRVNWSPDDSGAGIGETWRIEVWLGELRLGYLVVSFARSARAGEGLPGVVLVGTNRDVPIRFRIEEGAVLAALEGDCVIGGEIADCDVQEGEPGEEVESTVFEDQTKQRVAGLIRIPENAVDRKFAVILKHLQKNSIDGANIPEDDQFPFFLLIRAFDEDGEPIEFHADHPAYLALCQPADVPAGLIQFLSIFRFSDGTTETFVTNRVTPECTTNGNGALPGSLLERARDGVVHRVAGLFRAQPLQALHGGLNTTTERFSEFGAVLEEDLDEAPFDYGAEFEWSSSEGSGTGPSPFFTDVEDPEAQRGWHNCPHLVDGSEPDGGTGGGAVWPVGDFDASDQVAAASTIVLTKPFTLPSNAVGVTVWAAIDNDIRVFLNGEDITDTGAATTEPSQLQGIDGTGFLVNEGCAFLDQVTFTADGSDINPGGVNILEVHARDRGWVGYINVRVDVETLIP